MDVRTYDDFGFGFSWVTDEKLSRTSHALVDDGRVWLVDPVEADDAIERATALGTPAAVLQLLDRHNRDCEAVARRLGVPRLVVPDAVPDSPFEVIRALRIPRWRESALWWPARRALVVAEVLGTSHFYTGGRDGAAIALFLRLTPPGSLRDYEPEHLLVGHGPGIHGPAASTAVRDAYARSRRDLPRVLAALPGAMRA